MLMFNVDRYKNGDQRLVAESNDKGVMSHLRRGNATGSKRLEMASVRSIAG